MALIVFTAIVGTLMSTPGLPPLRAMLWGNLGIALAAASAAAINHVLDRRIDAQMSRTRGRPLPTGNLNERQALAFAAVLGFVSMAVLGLLVNPLTAVLTFASLIGYAIIYTAWLKRATSQNIVIGGAAGAAPPVLGWTAVTGHVDADALLLFLIIFAWTPPHFWALAIARRDEYARAGIPMLPVTHGVAHTRLHVLLYTVLLVLVTLLPYRDAHERPDLPGQRAGARCAVPLPRAGTEDLHAPGTADAGVPLFGQLSDVDVCGAARGSLPAHDPASAVNG